MSLDLADDDFFGDEGKEVNESDLKGLGELVPPGKYFAIVDKVKEVTATNKGTQGIEFTFRITEGPYAKRTVRDTLWLTEENKKRKLLFGCRLGIMVKTGEGENAKYVRNPGMTSWADTEGEPVIIEVEHQTDREDKTKKYAKLAYGGLYYTDDEKAAAAARGETPPKGSGPEKSNGAANGATKPTVAASSAKKQDYGDM